MEYTRLWHKADKNPDNIFYKEKVQAYIQYMKPHNKMLKEDKINKAQYLNILNDYIKQ